MPELARKTVPWALQHKQTCLQSALIYKIPRLRFRRIWQLHPMRMIERFIGCFAWICCRFGWVFERLLPEIPFPFCRRRYHTHLVDSARSSPLSMSFKLRKYITSNKKPQISICPFINLHLNHNLLQNEVVDLEYSIWYYDTS